MGFFLIVICIILCFMFPLVGSVTSGALLVTTHKKSRVLLCLFVLTLGYIFSFYLPSQTDDMFRYILYMNSVSKYSIIDFIKQMYSSQPVTINGLNGQTWPGSALLLLLVSKFSDYRVISAGTLVLTYAVRLMFIQSSWKNSQQFGYYAIWFLMTLFWIRPLLVLSGFRWYIGISLLMLSLSLESRFGFKMRYAFFYLAAALFHPGTVIFSALRFFSFLFIRNKKKAIAILFVFVVVGFIVLKSDTVLYYIDSLIRSFTAYTDNDWSNFQLLARLLSIILMLTILIKNIFIQKYKNISKIDDHILTYANIIIIFNLAFFWHITFNRLAQFTIPISLLLLSKFYFNKKQHDYKDLIIPLLAISIGAVLMFFYLPTSFPSFTQPALRIFLLPVHFLSK